MSTRAREIHIVGGSMVWHDATDAALCQTACGATSRAIAHACRATFGEGFGVRLHLTPSALGPDREADVTEDVGALADRLLADARTAVVFVATALCGAPAPAPASRRGSLTCLPASADAPPTEALLGRLRRRHPGVVFAAVTTTSTHGADARATAAALRDRAGCDLVLAIDGETGRCVVSDGTGRWDDLATQDRSLALRALAERARALVVASHD